MTVGKCGRAWGAGHGGGTSGVWAGMGRQNIGERIRNGQEQIMKTPQTPITLPPNFENKPNGLE